MVGVLLAGMKYYHQATGDPRAADVLVRAARWLARETYDPATNQFRYTSCPNSAKPSSTPCMACEGIAYACAADRRGGPGETLARRDQGPRGEDRRLRPQRDTLPASVLWDMDRLEDKQQATTVLGGVCCGAIAAVPTATYAVAAGATTGKTCR